VISSPLWAGRQWSTITSCLASSKAYCLSGRAKSRVTSGRPLLRHPWRPRHQLKGYPHSLPPLPDPWWYWQFLPVPWLLPQSRHWVRTLRDMHGHFMPWGRRQVLQNYTRYFVPIHEN